MTAQTTAQPRPTTGPGGASGGTGFGGLVRAEWVKFRSVRGWMIGIILAPLVTIGFGALTGSASQCGYEYPAANGQVISGP